MTPWPKSGRARLPPTAPPGDFRQRTDESRSARFHLMQNPPMPNSTINPWAAWELWKGKALPQDNAVMLAAAFVYAAERGWILDGPLTQGEGIPIDTKDGVEKLRARSAFLFLTAAMPPDADDAPGRAVVLRAVTLAPREWRYRAANLLRNMSEVPPVRMRIGTRMLDTETAEPVAEHRSSWGVRRLYRAPRGGFFEAVSEHMMLTPWDTLAVWRASLPSDGEVTCFEQVDGTLGVRLHPDLAEQAKQAAKAAGKPLNHWLADIVADGDLEAAEAPVAPRTAPVIRVPIAATRKQALADRAAAAGVAVTPFVAGLVAATLAKA